jgi:predicted DNA-binding transcriptional regulator YafY
MADSAGRLLRLLSLLQDGRDWPGSELGERLEVTGRTVRRDVDRLRDLGYPVEAARGRVGGYRLVGGSAMPPLLLEDDEAVAITLGLRTIVANAVDSGGASVRALAKLRQVLPAHLRGRVTAVASATSTLVWEAAPADPERLVTLARAVANHERVRFAYAAADASASERFVEPAGVVAVGRRWYLVGWDHRRSDWRSFRVDRMDDLRTAPGRFTPRALPGGDPATFMRAWIESMAPTFDAVAVVEGPADLVAARLPAGMAMVEPIDAARCRVTLASDTLDWLLWRLVQLDLPCVVESPAELAARAVEVAGRLRDAAGKPRRRAAQGARV